jgi:hypothetical protein
MLDGVVLVLVATGVVAGGFLAVGPRLLFRWYLREIRHLKVPEDRGEAIATYPFA